MLTELFHSTEPTSIPGSRVKVLFGSGSLDRLGELCKSLGGRRILLVTDPGIEAAGYPERAIRSMYQAQLVVKVFDHSDENPTTETVQNGLREAKPFNPDLIVGLGGGSSMDTAKGVNFLLTNGGSISDYHGASKATKPMLPMIAIPTTAGTGSEAQSYALISDPDTHVKMACGDPKALPRLAILDPSLTATQPPNIAAATGIDAAAHAIETSACNRRNDISRSFSKEAWQLLNAAYETVISAAFSPSSPLAPVLRGEGQGEGSSSKSKIENRKSQMNLDEARAKMLLGAHLAGCAIENSMLGAAHATANPLTSEFNITHGQAVGLMLPHVIRFNSNNGANPYSDLHQNAPNLANRISSLLQFASIPSMLKAHNIPKEILPRLANLASQQWTAQFNPRPLTEADLLAIYQAAYS
ncbi:MAG TPA: iron-containing alcohol dehydrogenase [Tepidisphaeraceae bacterium]|jgi:alcohol dehydrogenase|nr:iron-containing alcohol dehydrogenase [Tepidisphaeraceae bacterium]